jgi:hypothetical protein
MGGAKLTFQNEEFEVEKGKAMEFIRLGLAEPLEKMEMSPTSFATPVAITDYTEEELKEKTLKELREIAKNIGVANVSKMTKSEMIFAIRSKQLSNSNGGI